MSVRRLAHIPQTVLREKHAERSTVTKEKHIEKHIEKTNKIRVTKNVCYARSMFHDYDGPNRHYA
jgi:hypothetical protein